MPIFRDIRPTGAGEHRLTEKELGNIKVNIGFPNVALVRNPFTRNLLRTGNNHLLIVVTLNGDPFISRSIQMVEPEMFPICPLANIDGIARIQTSDGILNCSKWFLNRARIGVITILRHKVCP